MLWRDAMALRRTPRKQHVREGVKMTNASVAIIKQQVHNENDMEEH
jgi:hypothetical protein